MDILRIQRVLVAVVVALTAAFPARASGGSRAADSGRFTAEELARLQAGELVSRAREQTHRGLTLHGGMSWQLIHAPVDAVWHAVTDLSVYDQLLPHVASVQVVGGSADARALRIEHAIGPASVRYHLRMQLDPAARSIRFRVDEQRPGPVRAGFGELQVVPVGPRKSVVCWAILADLGSGVVRTLMRAGVQQAMLAIPERVKELVERRAGHLG